MSDETDVILQKFARILDDFTDIVGKAGGDESKARKQAGAVLYHVNALSGKYGSYAQEKAERTASHDLSAGRCGNEG